MPHAALLDLGDEPARRADADGLTAGVDHRVELRPEQQRQAHVDRRQVGDAQRPHWCHDRGVAWPLELGHRDARRVVDALAAQDHADGVGEDAGVEGQRRVVDVPDVEGQAFVPRRRVATVHLGPAGDARPNLQPAGLFVAVPVEVAHRQRPRPDERHLAAHDVDERRQLVETRRPQESADPGETLGVVLRAGLVGVRRSHRAELDELERPAAAAAASLAEQHRRAVDDPHDDRDRRDQRGRDDEQRGGDDDVDRPLHHDRDPTVRRDRAATASPPAPAVDQRPYERAHLVAHERGSRASGRRSGRRRRRPCRTRRLRERGAPPTRRSGAGCPLTTLAFHAAARSVTTRSANAGSSARTCSACSLVIVRMRSAADRSA